MKSVTVKRLKFEGRGIARQAFFFQAFLFVPETDVSAANGGGRGRVKIVSRKAARLAKKTKERQLLYRALATSGHRGHTAGVAPTVRKG